MPNGKAHPTDGTDGAILESLGYEIVAIVVFAFDGDKDAAGSCFAGIDADAKDLSFRADTQVCPYT
ncbi:MAG: hypothetical protein A2Y10_00485 [Planctomycetes bacterium GWF2_41_51]|nr:MAG: hypothetical protein A2Y10_00485 [Planctomycetes bacterium GWF2_41_51]